MRVAEPQLETEAISVEGVRVPGVLVRRSWQKHLLTFLMVFGPGLIVMEADNDAGAVSTYMQAGGQYGLHLLWTLIVLLPICYFVQEMVARLGIATGKGHAAMIYERFGKWWGRFSLFDLLVVNFLTLITEFAAISLALSAMGVSPLISVPVSALGLTLIVVTGSYLRWERIVIALCLLDLTWFVLAYLVHPAWAAVGRATIAPTMPAGGITSSLVFLVIAIVGTTIAPWQLFFQQSCVAEKRLRFSDLKWARLDTLIGAIFTVVVAGAMMLVGNYGDQRGVTFEDPAQLALAIGPMAGHFVRNGVSAADGECRRAGHDGYLARQCLGLRRGQRVGTLAPQESVAGAGILCDIHRLRRSGGGFCVDSACAFAIGHHQCPGLCGTDSSLGHHLSATIAQRPRVAWGALGEPAMEQRHQLDHHRGSLCPVAAIGCAGCATQSFRLRARGDLWQRCRILTLQGTGA